MADAFGIALPDPPDGWTPMEVVVLVKSLDAEGREVYFSRFSITLGQIEALGMLDAAHRSLADDVAAMFQPDTDGGGEE